MVSFDHRLINAFFNQFLLRIYFFPYLHHFSVRCVFQCNKKIKQFKPSIFLQVILFSLILLFIYIFFLDTHRTLDRRCLFHKNSLYTKTATPYYLKDNKIYHTYLVWTGVSIDSLRFRQIYNSTPMFELIQTDVVQQ